MKGRRDKWIEVETKREMDRGKIEPCFGSPKYVLLPFDFEQLHSCLSFTHILLLSLFSQILPSNSPGIFSFNRYQLSTFKTRSKHPINFQSISTIRFICISYKEMATNYIQIYNCIMMQFPLEWWNSRRDGNWNVNVLSSLQRTDGWNTWSSKIDLIALCRAGVEYSQS